ncbi:uncharacterized protein V6R79_012991 [Siganus canaliculatus]
MEARSGVMVPGEEAAVDPAPWIRGASHAAVCAPCLGASLTCCQEVWRRPAQRGEATATVNTVSEPTILVYPGPGPKFVLQKRHERVTKGQRVQTKEEEEETAAAATRFFHSPVRRGGAAEPRSSETRFILQLLAEG